MQGAERGADEVRPLAGVKHEQAQLVDEPEVLVQARLQLLRLCLRTHEGCGFGPGVPASPLELACRPYKRDRISVSSVLQRAALNVSEPVATTAVTV